MISTIVTVLSTVRLHFGASKVVLVVKNLPAKAGDAGEMGSIPGSGRSPGRGHGNPLWYSRLENPVDRVAWRVVESWTRLKRLSTCTQSSVQGQFVPIF